MTDITTWRCAAPPNTGQRQRFPSRFLDNLRKTYPYQDKNVLWMFAGSVKENGDTTDIRQETGAKIIAPYDNLPILDNTYDMVIADPPYADHYAGEWHTTLPKPKRILSTSE